MTQATLWDDPDAGAGTPVAYGRSQLRPPIRSYGAKISSARQIVAALPDDYRACYVEPFAGTIAVLLARRRARREVANDLNGDLVCFWRVVRDAPEELARVVAATPNSRAEFADCATRLAAGGIGDDIERARCVAVAMMQSHSGAGMTACTPGQWRRQMLSGPDWATVQDADWAAVAERISRVQLECRPAVEIIDACGEGTVVYCDPPYTATSDVSRYVVCDTDGFEAAALAAADRGARVAVSGYDGDWPALDAAGWRRVSWPTFTAGAPGVTTPRREVLWCSYRPDLGRLATAGVTPDGW